MKNYSDFLAGKTIVDVPTGFAPKNINSAAFDFQRDVIRWACLRGRAAILADCGMGKTLMEHAWAHAVVRETNKPVIIFAPLGVTRQHEREAVKFGYEVKYVQSQSEVTGAEIVVTNYQKLHRFDLGKFAGVVIDGSSILKSFDGQFRGEIIKLTKKTPYKLAATATAAPNDLIEIINHAEFLGVMSGKKIIALFFKQDGNTTHDWKLKGHSEKDFWKWVCSWAVNIRRPSDLGYSDNGFVLPKLNMFEHIVESNQKMDGYLFPLPSSTLAERRDARRISTCERVEFCVKLITNELQKPLPQDGEISRDALLKLQSCNRTSDGQSKVCAGSVSLPAEKWLVWCQLNLEQDALAKAFGDKCVSIQGSTPEEKREELEREWHFGNTPVLISKPSIFGFGMNWQHCSNVVFVGLSDSYETFYQAIRRCWRFGQLQNVNVHLIISSLEGAVLDNIKRKERESNKLIGEMKSLHLELK